MSQITTHVLDTALGRPAADLPLALFALATTSADPLTAGDWTCLGSGMTDADGRLSTLLEAQRRLPQGIYRMHFDTATYFRERATPVFYPFVDVVFQISGDGEHYHIPPPLISLWLLDLPGQLNS